MRVGVDLGGTKVEMAALTADGDMVTRRREATPSGPYAVALRTFAAMLLDFERSVGETCTFGICTPGKVLAGSGVLANAYSVAFNGHPVKPDLEALLGREVRFSNDARCFALSEAADGAARGSRGVFGVILGTGVGGGIVIDGRVIEGANAIAGEWGHNPLPWPRPEELPGPPCGCGRLGHIESFLSGRGLARDHERVTGNALPPERIAELAAGGDAACVETMARYEHRLARALAHIINVLDPDTIVLGGGLSSIARLYVNVPSRWGDYVYSAEVRTRLAPPAHGDASGVRGAAWLWPA